LCSISLVATAIANPLELNFGRGVLHGALQTLHFGLIDMHKLTHNIQEVIVFTKWLSDKQILRNVLSLKYVLYSHIWTLGTISLLRVGTNSARINSEKSTTELNGPHFSEFGRLQI
jgi:hypothetical protein